MKVSIYILFVLISSFCAIVCAKKCLTNTIDYQQFYSFIATGETFIHIYSVENFPDDYGKSYTKLTAVNENTVDAFIYTYNFNSMDCELFFNTTFDVKRRVTKFYSGKRRHKDYFITLDGGGFQFRYFSQAPDKYFWIFGCLNGTTQSWNTCPFKFFDLAIPDIRPGKAGEINLSGLPWHLIAQDLRIIGIKFSDPDMTYIWQGPACSPSDFK